MKSAIALPLLALLSAAPAAAATMSGTHGMFDLSFTVSDGSEIDVFSGGALADSDHYTDGDATASALTSDDDGFGGSVTTSTAAAGAGFGDSDAWASYSNYLVFENLTDQDATLTFELNYGLSAFAATDGLPGDSVYADILGTFDVYGFGIDDSFETALTFGTYDAGSNEIADTLVLTYMLGAYESLDMEIFMEATSYATAETAAPIPLPAAGLMLLGGLGGLSVLRRRANA